MFIEFIKNPVLISVVIMLILSALRLNVVFALVILSLLKFTIWKKQKKNAQ